MLPLLCCLPHVVCVLSCLVERALAPPNAHQTDSWLTVCCCATAASSLYSFFLLWTGLDGLGPVSLSRTDFPTPLLCLPSCALFVVTVVLKKLVLVGQCLKKKKTLKKLEATTI
mmetsp:Transcript_11895/g.39163  ORF Transcript_11895/g.39163 Transcript_11895/m.39163 type:complete len:114 (+) Transcript_11895:1518-1859(+)